MSRLAVLAILAVCIVGTAPVSQADIVYTVNNNASLQQGYTLTGTITTDGKIGDLAGSDIGAWSITATNGTATYTTSGTGAIIDGSVTASSTALTVSGVTQQIDTYNSFTLKGDDGWVYELTNFANNPGNAPFSYTHRSAMYQENPPYLTAFLVFDSSITLPFAALTIATASAAVPEPSTVVLATIVGAIGLGGAAVRKRKLAKLIDLDGRVGSL